MKIGIVTLPFHINYGGILQAYALSQVLIKEEHEVVFIQEHKNICEKLKNSIGVLVRKMICKLKGRKINIFDDKSRHKKIQSFLKKEFNFISNSKIHYINSFDAVIVGSDQVWRKWSQGWNLYFYFLDFVKNKKTKKISYAASLGTNRWLMNNEETERILKLISDFKGISVRESDAKDICQEHLKVIPKIVLDPTLLLGIKDYVKIGANPMKANYIVSFILDNNAQKQNISDRISSIIASELIALGPEMQIDVINGSSLLGIEEWIRIYSQAKFIITDSFHGSAFAINFNIPFIVLSNINRGQSRLVSLLQTYNLLDRLVTDVNQVEEIVSKPIEWGFVNKKVNELRKISIDFLRSSLDL